MAPSPARRKSLPHKTLYRLHYINKKMQPDNRLHFNYSPDIIAITIPTQKRIANFISSPHGCKGFFLFSGLRAVNNQGE